MLGLEEQVVELAFGLHAPGALLGVGADAEVDVGATGGATMFASISGTGQPQRSVESDDEAGVQFIYGADAAASLSTGGQSQGWSCALKHRKNWTSSSR